MLNHITIMGRLTRDVEMRKTGSGVSVANFSVAVDRDFKSESGDRETDFIDCVAWRSTADFLGKYFRKGSMIVLSGRLQVRSWLDNDGNKRKSAEVVAENVYFGEAKKDAAPSTGSSFGNAFTAPPVTPIAPTDAEFSVLDGDDEQLPF